MEQIHTQLFQSACGKAKTYVENDMALGNLHDYLMEFKGDIVGRMVKAQNQEQEQADAVKASEDIQPELEAI